MARFYADENFPREAVDVLRGHGHDVLTAREAGRANQRVPDPEVLAFAISEQRAVLTFNRQDFIRLHYRVPEHWGIVVCRYDPDFLALAQRVHAAVQSQDLGLAGKLLRVNRPPR